MCSRSDAAALVLIATLFAGCNSQLKPGTPAKVEPASVSWIGPQPGPDGTVQAATNPYAGERSAMGEGRKFFNAFNCSGCHGDHAGGGMGPSLRDSMWYYGNSDAQIFASIYQGRDKGMPAWGTKLSPDQIWKIITYIKSMRTVNEPDPPH